MRTRIEGGGGDRRTDEESAGEVPLLGAADDGEREPVRGDEGMQERHRRDPADRRQILGAEAFHPAPRFPGDRRTRRVAGITIGRRDRDGSVAFETGGERNSPSACIDGGECERGGESEKEI